MTDQEPTTTERWLPIPGYEGIYSISDKGRVRRETKACRTFPGRIFIGRVAERGYQITALRENGIPKRFSIHRLVMLAFVGPYPEGKEINHKNGHKSNNVLENLEYVTRSQNGIHSCQVLKNGIGERHGGSKLVATQVIEIREQYSQGRSTLIELAKKHGVVISTIAGIVKRTDWKHI